MLKNQSNNQKKNSTKDKDFITYREFVQDHSFSSDLNLSLNSIEGSFFSESSDKAIENILANPILPLSKPKEEETNYTSKVTPVILEKEEFRKAWLCNSCLINSADPCSFCLIF